MQIGAWGFPSQLLRPRELIRGGRPLAAKTHGSFHHSCPTERISQGADYANLHVAMKRRGFSRFIEAGSGLVCHMPHAEYNRVEDLTSDQVLEDARAAP